MDWNEEAEPKGKIVECGKVHFALKNRRFTLIDVPRHTDSAPNMISGVWYLYR